MSTKRSSVKRNLIISVTALVISVAMLIGTTFAWFTDSVTSGTNKIVAGNLDVKLQYSTGKVGNDWNWRDVTDKTELFNSKTWEPNHTEVVYLKVINNGSLAFDYTLNVSPVDETQGINQVGNPFKLSEYLVFGTTEPRNTEFENEFTREDAQKEAGNVRGLETRQGELTRTGHMLSGTTENPSVQYLAMVVYMPHEVGNDANYKTGTTAPTIDFKLTLTAKQTPYEQDSFGKDYDQTADLTPDNADNGKLSYKFHYNVEQSATVVKNENGTVTVNGNTTVEQDGSFKIESKQKLENSTTSVATATIPVEALADDVTEVTFSVVPTDLPTGFSVEAGKETQPLEVTVKGLKENNKKLIKVEAFIGKGLKNVKLYHIQGDTTTEMTGFGYNIRTGILDFSSASFSPFVAVYDAPVAIIGTTTYNTLGDAVNAVQKGDTITLLEDVSLDNAIGVSGGQSFTLNLNGKTVTAQKNFLDIVNGNVTLRGGTVIANGTVASTAKRDGNIYGKLTITDGTYTATGSNDTLKATGGKIVVDGGTFSGVNAMYVTGGGKIEVNSGNFTGTYALYEEAGGSAIINGGNFTAREFACAVTDGSSLVIDRGTFTSKDNAVVGTNGSSNFAGSTITINGGTFNGNIESEDYIACGVYVANNDTVSINAGTFNITNGVGVLARAGKTTIGEDVVINLTNTGSITGGWVGDNKNVIGISNYIVKDVKAQYPGASKGEFTINCANSNYEIVTIE